jgi:hypothetical protein
MDTISALYGIFTCAGLLCALIYFFTSGISAYGSLISAYSTLFIGMVMLLINIFYVIVKNNGSSSTSNGANGSNNNNMTMFFKIFGVGIFMLMMFGSIGLNLYLLIVFKDRIISENVTSGYWTMNIVSIILMIVQSGIVFTILYKNKENFSSLAISSLCFFGLLNVIVSIINFNILSYFYTDGFCPLNHT